MLRKLTQSSASGDAEDAIQQVGEAIGANHEMLEGVLKRNHGELVKLSAVVVPDMKEEVLREMDEVLAGLRLAWNGVRSELLGAKSRADMEAVKRSGRSLNDLKGLMRRLDDERRLITRNSELATLLVTVCCRVLPVRQVDPAALRNIPPSYEGYQRIMDFYFFTDASLYCFGDRLSGPNWFARLKRNVAILFVEDDKGNVVYNDFAVSGEHSTPGAPLAPEGGVLTWTEAEDKHGRVFDRRNDAEFKLLSGLSAALGITDRQTRLPEWRGSGTLWSRKPLCASCWGAVRQLAVLLPRLKFSVSVGEPGCEEQFQRRVVHRATRRTAPIGTIGVYGLTGATTSCAATCVLTGEPEGEARAELSEPEAPPEPRLTVGQPEVEPAPEDAPIDDG